MKKIHLPSTVITFTSKDPLMGVGGGWGAQTLQMFPLQLSSSQTFNVSNSLDYDQRSKKQMTFAPAVLCISLFIMLTWSYKMVRTVNITAKHERVSM